MPKHGSLVYVAEVAGADVSPRVFTHPDPAFRWVSEAIVEEDDGSRDELLESLRGGSDVGGKDWSVYPRRVEDVL